MRILIDTTNPSDALMMGMHCPMSCEEGGLKLGQEIAHGSTDFVLTSVGGEIRMTVQEAREIAKMILNRTGA